MTIHYDSIGLYSLQYNDETNYIYIHINYNGEAPYQTLYESVPTEEECNARFGTQGLPLSLENCFKNCVNMVASPKLPNSVYSVGYGSTSGCFNGCNSLVIPPKLPTQVLSTNIYECGAVFRDCVNLVQGAVLPYNAVAASYTYYEDISLKTPVSIPQNVNRINYLYNGCTSLSGEFCIKSTSMSSYSRALYNTVKPITIYGDRSLCEAVAATANNGNASWSAWYEPETPVTNRGQGSRTTAEDMTRMVRNGALAVPSYAPGRMVYHRGDFVREDEWDALVAAAQTIDPTVTASTRYDNLNKIEAAFGSAL